MRRPCKLNYWINKASFINFICLLTVSVIFLETSDAAQSKKECYYNPGIINYKYFLDNTKFSHARWDQSKSEARITLKEEGEAVKVRYVACETFGMSAKLKMKKLVRRLDPEFLIKKIKWLGRNTLSDLDYALMVKAVSKNEFIDDLGDIVRKEVVFVGVEDTDYQSFAVYVVIDRDELYFEIFWYM